MTWEKFIAAAVKAGVRPTDVIAYIDWAGLDWSQPERTVRVEELPLEEGDPPTSRRIAIT